MKIVVDEQESNSLKKDKGYQVFKAKIKLSQVTRDAKMRIRFLAPILTSDLV
jgi:hypothetical protein